MARQSNLLFNAKTVKRLCQDVVITDKQKEAAREWLKLLDENKLEDEKKNYLRFGQIILQDILGYSTKEIDFENDNVEFQFTNSEGKKVLCFEAKGTSIKDLFAPQHRQKKEHETPIKQTWDYMGSIGLDYGICTNYKDFEYNNIESKKIIVTFLKAFFPQPNEADDKKAIKTLETEHHHHPTKETLGVRYRLSLKLGEEPFVVMNYYSKLFSIEGLFSNTISEGNHRFLDKMGKDILKTIEKEEEFPYPVICYDCGNAADLTKQE